MSDLKIGTGFSKNKDSFQAGIEAAKFAIKPLNSSPDAVIVFASPHFKHQDLLNGISSITGETILIGGTTAGEIDSNGAHSNSVVLMAIKSDTLKFYSAIGYNMSRSEKQCTRELATDILSKTSTDTAMTLLIFPNGLGGDGIKVIDGLYSSLGDDIEIAGGFLGDEENFSSTYQYYNGKVYKDSIPGLLICGNSNFTTGIGVRSGFESIGNKFFCTESDGNTVIKFDDKRALDVYKNFLGEERAKRLPSICLEYPFGLIDEKTSLSDYEYIQLRSGLTVDEEKGTINLAGSIPEGSPVTLTTGSRNDLINGAKLATQQAVNTLNGAKPLVALIFSCIGRKLVLGRRKDEEVLAIKEILGKDVPFIGFYTYGEIGPINKSDKSLSKSTFHNETVIIWLLGEKN